MNGFLATMAVAATMVVPTGNQMQWHQDYGAGLRACKAAEQPLLVVLEKPADARQRVEQITFTADASGQELLEQYTLCRVDVSTEYGRRVAEVFGAEQFPYTAIIDNAGQTVLYRKAGQFDNREWVTTLAAYQDGQRELPAPVIQQQPAGDFGGFQLRGVLPCFT